MPLEIHVPRAWSMQEKVQSLEARVGPRGRLAGTHIDDHVQLAKMIVLCEFCNPKFNPKQNRYEVWRHQTWLRGPCDGCGDLTLHGRGFIAQSLHDEVGEWERRPISARRGRWATR